MFRSANKKDASPMSKKKTKVVRGAAAASPTISPKREKSLLSSVNWMKRWKHKGDENVNAMATGADKVSQEMDKLIRHRSLSPPRQASAPRRNVVASSAGGGEPLTAQSYHGGVPPVTRTQPFAYPKPATNVVNSSLAMTREDGILGDSWSSTHSSASFPTPATGNSSSSINGSRHGEASAIAIPATESDRLDPSAVSAIAIVENDRLESFYHMGNKSDATINYMSQMTSNAPGSVTGSASAEEPLSPILRRAPSVSRDELRSPSRMPSQPTRMSSRRRQRSDGGLPHYSDHGISPGTAAIGPSPSTSERRLKAAMGMGRGTPDNDVVLNGVVCAVQPVAGPISAYYDQPPATQMNAQQDIMVGPKESGLSHARAPPPPPPPAPPLTPRGRSMPSWAGEPLNQHQQEDEFETDELGEADRELQDKMYQAEETIKILQQTIELQEDREQELEEKIRETTFRAHAKLSEGKKNPAVRDMKKVKLYKVEQGRINKAIQTMERQILSIESALNNIKVTQAVMRGSQTMERLLPESKLESEQKKEAKPEAKPDSTPPPAPLARKMPSASPRLASNRKRNSNASSSQPPRRGGTPCRNNSLTMDDLFTVQEESIMSLDDVLHQSVQSLAEIAAGTGGTDDEEDENEGPAVASRPKSSPFSFEDSIADLDDALNSSLANLDFMGTASSPPQRKGKGAKKDFVQEMKAILSKPLVEDHSLHKSTKWEEDELLLEELQATMLKSTSSVVVLNEQNSSNHNSCASTGVTPVEVMQILPFEDESDVDASRGTSTLQLQQ